MNEERVKMKKYMFLLLIFIPLFCFSFNLYYFPSTLNIEDIRLVNFSNHFCINLNEQITVLEACSLEEFTQLTKLPYSYYAGALIVSKNYYYIVVLPFEVLHKKNIFYSTLVHEIMHYYLESYFEFSEDEQEDIISQFLKGEFK
jgi:hypothetical protein